MKSVFNQETLLWIIGLLQPVSSTEIIKYMEIVLEGAGTLPSKDTIRQLCEHQVKQKRIIQVNSNPDLFSLTSRGNNYLSRSRRLSRDKFRLYLLKQSRKSRLRKSCEDASELGGVSPSVDERTSLKSCEANKLGLRLSGKYYWPYQYYWPRISKQLISDAGQSQSSHDEILFPLLSFKSASQLSLTLDKKEGDLQLDFETLGMILGISPGLIMQIAMNKERHYRQYPLAKKGGGERIISSPRTFLKIIQQFLADYSLSGLPMHSSVHSYRYKHSIISNASMHVGKKFVGNVDIVDYFGSIKEEYVKNTLEEHRFGERSAKIISRLCTLNDSLPQGAPTSPILSNTFLFKFDQNMSEYSAKLGLSFSRYADDISISGNDISHIKEAIKFARNTLSKMYGLKLNEDKTRIASSGGQQRVTGVVVNDAPRPPRKFRREVRAAFNNASKESTVSFEAIRRLSGYLSFLKSFETLNKTPEILRLQKEMETLKSKLPQENN